MKLKRYLSAIVCFAFIFSLVSCKSDDDKGGVNNNVTLKGVNSEESTGVSVKSDATSASFSVYTPVTPTVSTSESWVTATATEPSKMNSISLITLTLQPNESTEKRSADVMITAAGSSITVTLTQAAGEAKEPEPTPPSDVTQALLGLKALDIAKDIKNGWNIGNSLEVPGNETGWGNPKVNQNYIDGVKSAGFNAVRIPCAWDSYITDSDNTINPTWLDRVNEVIHMVVDNEMYAIVNIHWDGGWLENNIGNASKPELLEKQKTLWTQIAKRLAHFNERLLFAGLNEPNADNAASTSALLEYEQAFVDAVRATGGNNSVRTLVFQGPNTDIENTYKYMTSIPKDPAGDGYLMAEVHYYTPYQFCLMEKDESWGKVAWFWGKDYHVEGSDRNATWGEEDEMKKLFGYMKEQFVDKGIPVVLGEYGAYPNEHLVSLQTAADKEQIVKSREFFYNCVQKFGKEKGLIPFVWDTGEIINRNNGAVKNQGLLDAILSGANASVYPY